MRNFLSALFFSLIVGGVWGQVVSLTINSPTSATESSFDNTFNATCSFPSYTFQSAQVRRGFLIAKSWDELVALSNNLTNHFSGATAENDYLTVNSFWSNNAYSQSSGLGIISYNGTNSISSVTNAEIILSIVGTYYIKSFLMAKVPDVFDEEGELVSSGYSHFSMSGAQVQYCYPGFIEGGGTVSMPQTTSLQVCNLEYSSVPLTYVLPTLAQYHTISKVYYSDLNSPNIVTGLYPISGQTFYIALKVVVSDNPATSSINEATTLIGPRRPYVNNVEPPKFGSSTIFTNPEGLNPTSYSSSNPLILGRSSSGALIISIPHIGLVNNVAITTTTDASLGNTPDPETISLTSINSAGYINVLSSAQPALFNASSTILPLFDNGDLQSGESGFLQIVLYGQCHTTQNPVFKVGYVPAYRLPSPSSLAQLSEDVCEGTLVSEIIPQSQIEDGYSFEWSLFQSTTAPTLASNPLISYNAILSLPTYYVRNRMLYNGVYYYSDKYVTLNVSILPDGTWTGVAGNNDFDDPANWCGGVVPTSPTIPPGVTVYLDGSYNFTNVTVSCGGSLIITETGRVNITNVLTNGGIVQVINGGTIKYGTTVAQIGTCNGTYEYKESFPASSRFWYLGSTITNATRESFGVVGSSSTGTQMWDWTEATQGYTLMGTANTPLTVGRGYVWKNNSGSTMNVTLTGTYNSAPVTISSLTRQGTGSFAGFHLISNPYTSYLDIHQVLGGINTSPTNLFTNSGTQNMWRDAWVRSISSGGAMVFDAYNATSGIGTGTSTVALSSGLTPTSVGRWIAPMQGVWVRVKPGMTGSIYMDNTMTNPNPAGAGQLRSASAVEGLARINVVYGNQIDQMVAALSPNASNAQDAYDTEKMFITNYVQVYAPNTGKKFAINTLKNSKSKVSMPITIECPGSGWYSINLAELELPNGVLFLEDKLNGEMKDLTIDSSYQFFANSGVLATRFVLHFHLPTIVANPSGPSSMDDLVSESQNAVIDIRANGSGKVNVSLDMVDEVTNSFVRICDMNGRILESFQIDGSSFEFQMNHGQGIYLVEVSNGLTVEKKKVFVQ